MEVGAARVEEVPAGSRTVVAAILQESFSGIYRWHALRTLSSVERVRAAFLGDQPAGAVLFTSLAPGTGYVYYVAVRPAFRGAGVGGFLLEDALDSLRGGGGREVLACIRFDNAASLRLFSSRGFARFTLGAAARDRGFAAALALWRRMVVAPGERVYRRALP